MAESGSPIGRNIKGVVTWFSPSRGFGYIESDPYSTVFFHRSQIDPNCLDSLSINSEVVFDVYQNALGWKAFNVSTVTVIPDKTGTIKWYNPVKGFGYITCDVGDVKVVSRDLPSGATRTFTEGTPVKFDLEKTERYMKARNVTEYISDADYLNVLTLFQAEIEFELLSVNPDRGNSGDGRNRNTIRNASVNGATQEQNNASFDPFKDVVGSVTFWNRRRNFGFIKCPHGKVYVHKGVLQNERSFLDRGDVVTFDIESTPRGLKAVNVRFIPDDMRQDFNISDESEVGATAAFMPIDAFEYLLMPPDYASSSSSGDFVYGHDSPYRSFLPQRNAARSGRRRNRRRSQGLSDIASGFDSSRFVDENIPQQLICPICLGVFNDPVSAPCEHAFCKGCIYRWLREDDLCPVDRETLDEEDLKPLPLLLRGILGQLRIRCAHEGCNSVVNMDDIHEHEEKCPFKKTKTQNGVSNCTKKHP